MRKSTILTDEVIRLTGVKAAENCPSLFRRIEFYDAQQARTFEFLTNTMKLGATTIAAIYKDRWQYIKFGSISNYCHKTICVKAGNEAPGHLSCKLNLKSRYM